MSAGHELEGIQLEIWYFETRSDMLKASQVEDRSNSVGYEKFVRGKLVESQGIKTEHIIYGAKG